MVVPLANDLRVFVLGWTGVGNLVDRYRNAIAAKAAIIKGIHLWWVGTALHFQK
jgi:hypothetical protein